MKTFFAWLIANIGGITAILLVVIYEILLLCGTVNEPDGTNFWLMSLVGIAAISLCCEFLGGLQATKETTDVVNLIIIAAVYYFAFDHARYFGAEVHQLTAFAWRIIPCGIFAIAAAIFTACNMDEVVSLRMLYQNSDSDMFEMTALYTINRFTASLSAASCVSLLYVALRVWNVMFPVTA